MKVKEMKNKVKIWIKDHSEETIKLGAVMMTGMAVAEFGIGVLFGKKLGANEVYRNRVVLKAGTPIETIVKSVDNTYPHGCMTFAMKNAELTPDQLGELGKEIIELGGSHDDIFTHFILGGPDKEEI